MENKDLRLAALEALAALDEKLSLAKWPENQEILGYRLVCTCSACPEQYDVFDKDGKQVGYLRLRHGHFRADFPECGGETVYESDTDGDGVFMEEERMPQLTKAIAALQERAARGS
jgi:hypothetical protein